MSNLRTLALIPIIFAAIAFIVLFVFYSSVPLAPKGTTSQFESLELKSVTFTNGSKIPTQYTCDGLDI